MGRIPEQFLQHRDIVRHERRLIPIRSRGQFGERLRQVQFVAHGAGE
jgi:hypothetical protein